MPPPKQLRIVFILAIVSFIVPISRSAAQQNAGNSISIIFPFLSDMEAPGNIISGKLGKMFAEHGIKTDRFAPLALIAAPAEFPDKGIIVITFLFARALPAEVMSVIKQNADSIYSSIWQRKLPPESGDISSGLLFEQIIDYRKIGMTGYYKTIVTDMENLDDDLNGFVDEAIKYELSGNISPEVKN